MKKCQSAIRQRTKQEKAVKSFQSGLGVDTCPANENIVPYNAIANLVDITNYEQVEKKLEQANKAKSRFLSILSHEIRGPISNVISAVDLIKPGKVVSPEDYQKMTEVIETQAREALEILRNTSYYLELDAGSFEQKTSSIYLLGFLQQLQACYQMQAKEGVSFSCELLHKNISRVEFDASHVRQILKIIIDNAIKFTDSGVINLSVELLPPNTLRFILKDTGCGISESYLSNIFKTFLSAEILKSERSYLKTGLKLPLACRIAELAGGSLTIESILNIGTTVCFDIPCEEISFQKKERPPTVFEESESNNEDVFHASDTFFPFSILLIEDDATNAELELRVLKKLGCHVIWVDSAFKAIEVLGKKNFDLIFIDITLPDMTGVALADTIRWTLPQKTQMVAVTSHSTEQDLDYFLSHGMMARLGKPLTEADFKRFFQDYLCVLEDRSE